MNLSGPEKAVLMLLSLDETAAAPIIAELEADDVRKLRAVASQMRAVPAQALDTVYKEFVTLAKDEIAVPRGGIRYLRRIATRALGEAKASEIFVDAPQSAMLKLSEADPAALSAVMEREHPQLVAAILSQLDTAKAAKVLSSLPEAQQTAVLERLGHMTEVPGGLLEEVATALVAELPTVQNETFRTVDGITQSAQLVRQLNREVGEAVLNHLEEGDGELAAEIRRAMYSFDDLKALDLRGLRALLEAVPVEKLTLSLKTASVDLRAHIFASLSKRAAQRIEEDLGLMGAVKLADVEAAQQEIVETALRLESEGVLTLDTGGNDVV